MSKAKEVLSTLAYIIIILGGMIYAIQWYHVESTSHKELIPVTKYDAECGTLSLEERGYYCEKGGISY